MKKASGFTLVELMVSIGIFTVITSIAVFNHNQFNSSVLLTNLSYEIALSVRQAQFYGITVRQSTISSGSFDSGYGIHFDLGTSKTQYTLYEDRNPQNHIYVSSELLQNFTIQKGNTISKIILTNKSGAVSTPNIVDISFIRPNPDTYITASNVSSVTYNKAEICVTSPNSIHRRIIVGATGQISVSTEGTEICN